MAGFVGGLGRLPATDPRNERHRMRRLLAAPPPALPVPDLRTWPFSGIPLDQGETGTCTTHAAAHFLHCGPLPHRGFLNPFDLYRETVLLDEYTDNDAEATGPIEKMQGGSSGTGAAKALEKRGLISEYLWADTLADLTLWVLTRGPVMVGTNWYRGMFEPTPEGFVKIPQRDRIAGGHEWLIRAVDVRRGVAEAVNSWGILRFNAAPTGKWGGSKLRPGHFLIDMNTLERLFHEDGDVVSCIEKKKEKK